MPEKLKTYVWLILDESGSMAGVHDDTIGGVNTYLSDRQREATELDLDIFVSIVKFNTSVTELYSNIPVADAKMLDYRSYSPGGYTALLDAVGSTIHKQETLISPPTAEVVEVTKTKKRGKKKGAITLDAAIVEATPEPDFRVLVVIFTDGQENASCEYDTSKIREMIEDRTNRGNYTFSYVGANQDSWGVSRSLGILKGNTANYRAASSGASLRSMSTATAMYMAAPSAKSDALYSKLISSDGFLKTDEDDDDSDVSSQLIIASDV